MRPTICNWWKSCYHQRQPMQMYGLIGGALSGKTLFIEGAWLCFDHRLSDDQWKKKCWKSANSRKFPRFESNVTSKVKKFQRWKIGWWTESTFRSFTGICKSFYGQLNYVSFIWNRNFWVISRSSLAPPIFDATKAKSFSSNDLFLNSYVLIK